MKLLTICLTLFLFGAAQAADAPKLRIAVLSFGTVNWLMETIEANDLDAAHGYELEVVGLASGNAARVALLAGEVDTIVADWLWALNRRAAGADMRFAAYSRTLGKLMSDPGVDSLCELKGRKIGVVGGPSDKSWIVLQALAGRECGFDLAAETEGLYGAPPLMSRQLTDGSVSAVSTYWHFAARLEAAGAKPLVAIDDAMRRLGVAPAPPLIGFTWEAGKPEPAALQGFLQSVRAAGEILAAGDDAWAVLRPSMKTASDAEFAALRDAYRAGIIRADWTDADTAGAKALYDLMTLHGGAEFAATAGPFDAAVFDAPMIGGE